MKHDLSVVSDNTRFTFGEMSRSILLPKQVPAICWLLYLVFLFKLGNCYDATEGTCEGNKEKTDSCINKCMATCEEQCTYNNYGCTDDCLVIEVKLKELNDCILCAYHDK